MRSADRQELTQPHTTHQVQEFSKSASNPMKLLELFIEASGGKEMLVLHKELIEHSRNFKNASGEFEKNTGLKVCNSY